MNIKRITAAILTLVMLLSLAACGTNAQDSGDSSTETISESEAMQKARNYIESDTFGKQQFVNSAMPNGAESMFNIDAGSSSLVGESTDGGYMVQVKGNFYANDEYGNLYGHYTYECTVDVSSTGSCWLDTTSVSVRKA